MAFDPNNPMTSVQGLRSKLEAGLSNKTDPHSVLSDVQQDMQAVAAWFQDMTVGDPLGRELASYFQDVNLYLPALKQQIDDLKASQATATQAHAVSGTAGQQGQGQPQPGPVSGFLQAVNAPPQQPQQPQQGQQPQR